VEGGEMTRAMKITFAAAAILGLGIGIYLGHSEALQVSNLLKSDQYLAATRTASEFARLQFMHADTDHARQAVMLQIHLLEQLELADKTFHEDSELGLAYIRLAMIEEASGHPENERPALVRARACYEKSFPGRQHGTDAELKDIVKKLDQAADKL
jgi:hypothetical protein